MKRTAAVFSLLLFAAAAPVAAQDAGPVECPDPTPGIDSVFPTVGARDVTVDAPLRVRYTRGYFGPEGPGGDPTMMLTVQRCDTTLSCDFPSCSDGGTPVSGRVQILGDEIVFFPEGGRWEAGATYSGEAIARFGGDLPFNFCVDEAGSIDNAAPELGRIGELTSDPIDPRCDAPDGGFRVGVFFDPATDNGPLGSIEYLVYQTRGPGIDGPVVRNRARAFSTGGQVAMGFVLPPDDATSTICVRVAAVDGAGNVDFDDIGDETAQCVDPVQGNFFYGLCSVGAPGAPTRFALGLAAFGVVAFMLVLRRR